MKNDLLQAYIELDSVDNIKKLIHEMELVYDSSHERPSHHQFLKLKSTFYAKQNEFSLALDIQKQYTNRIEYINEKVDGVAAQMKASYAVALLAQIEKEQNQTKRYQILVTTSLYVFSVMIIIISIIIYRSKVKRRYLKKDLQGIKQLLKL